MYRADPRFQYNTDDVGGSIYLKDEHHASVTEAGQAYVKSFGFSFDDDLNRAVAVGDLHGLVPEQQQLWRTFELTDTYELHPGYFQTEIQGQWWPEKVSYCRAFIEELGHINAMCEKMKRAPLFRNVPEERPSNFTFLLRPTTKEFEEFVHLLDKLMSDNINTKFFGGDLELMRVETRKDGTNVETQKGTIQLLAEWLDSRFRPDDREPIEQLIAAFKSVRKLRQSPAHKIAENAFDPSLFKRQRKLVIEAYTAIRTIRLVFAKDPAVSDYSVPTYLYEGNIWPY